MADVTIEKEIEAKDNQQSSEKTKEKMCFFFNTFPDKSLECLYQSFSVKQKRAGLLCFVCTTILFDIHLLMLQLATMQLGCIYTIGITVAMLLKLLPLPLFYFKDMSSRDVQLIWPYLPYLYWLLASVEILVWLVVHKGAISAREYLAWVILLDYFIYVTLPLRQRYCVLLSLVTCASYTIVIYFSSYSARKTLEQYACNFILLLTSNILGLTSYLIEDKQQRRAFLETRQSLEVKLVIEEQSAEQERLLLSVLPEHVAVQMRQDLDQTDSQFKKIYMSRHENVSILYADIVGFTAISSTYSAQELVKMLNELFARFDKLAEKYHQLRIKILGDCYYCISGAPVERPDHAVLCVHMGLSMVKAIKYVQQTANSPVDMRVGIHTGAVLAGVLGQRQWQFDVYSKDVELANKMESSGKAGKVHISATTLSFLNGEFEIERAYGEKRDEALRIAGLKTYFIVKVLKPFEEQNEVQNGDTNGALDTDGCVISEMKTMIDDKNNVENKDRSREDSAEFKSRLRKELVSRDGHAELVKKTNFITLWFVDDEKENAYMEHRSNSTSLVLLLFVVIWIATEQCKYFTLSKTIASGGQSLIMEICFLLSLLFQLLQESSLQWKCLKNVKPPVYIKMVFIIMAILSIGSINLIDTEFCKEIQNDTMPVLVNCSEFTVTNTQCLYPSEFSCFTVLLLIAISLLTCLNYMFKSAMMTLYIFVQGTINTKELKYYLNCEKYQRTTGGTDFELNSLLLASLVALIFLVRHMEQVLRVLFLWRSEVEEQRNCAEDLKRRNEALVYNILPSHVAAHFMGNRNRNHDELYSQSYEEVGVLFASMPNFSDFYSEETVNNQGLECLRFLNEVISDFDALLQLPKYQDVIKIKTIGSTYMAASGLNPSRQIKPDDPVKVRWAHLARLVEFARDLRRALRSINEQSFNHFVLKVGINHGPITAGVIGARKPHYDIWGNTVNVASRMESTGKAGRIQVTEETCQILQAFDYEFEQRGWVAVKGKGKLMTYYVSAKRSKKTPPTAPVSPSRSVSGMEPVIEEDESRGSFTSKSDEMSVITVIECTTKPENEVFMLETETSEVHQDKKETELKDSNEATLLLSSCDG